ESGSFLIWAISTGSKMADPDASLLECTRLLKWAYSKSELAAESDPEVSGKSLDDGTSLYYRNLGGKSSSGPILHQQSELLMYGLQRADWMVYLTPAWKQEYIGMCFTTAKLDEHAKSNTHKPARTSYAGYRSCRTELEDSCEDAKLLGYTPEAVLDCVLIESDMIEGRPSINDYGFFTIELSRNWIAKSIHKMLEAGMDTWIPKLPVERVIIDYPTLDEEMHVDLCCRCFIGDTLMSILKYSKVDVTVGHPAISPTRSKKHRAHTVLHRWFSTEARQDRTQSDFDNAYKDLLALWYGLQRSYWMVCLTLVGKQEYIKMCFSTAKLEERAKSNRHKPARTSYAGYLNCSIELERKLLERARTHVAVEQAEDAQLLGYTPEAVLDCVLKYTYLKTHRLAECKLNDEIFKEEGNTFLYLLNTQAKIRRITDDSREDINELKKASELILGKTEGWEKGEERMLGFRLLEFTEAGSVTDTSTLLLCEATALVMEKCFHLLGISPTSSFFLDQTLPRASQLSVSPLLLRLELSAWERRMDVNTREKKKKIFGVLITQNPAAVFRRSLEFAPSDRHDFCTEASLHIKEGLDRWDLNFEAWKFCFLPGQIASCLVIFFLSCSLFVAIYLDIDSKIMMIVVCL
ncbi:arginine--tRNA ligase, chloroplastic/mitochondrial, partial [Tanacetum coccineum]